MVNLELLEWFAIRNRCFALSVLIDIVCIICFPLSISVGMLDWLLELEIPLTSFQNDLGLHSGPRILFEMVE